MRLCGFRSQMCNPLAINKPGGVKRVFPIVPAWVRIVPLLPKWTTPPLPISRTYRIYLRIEKLPRTKPATPRECTDDQDSKGHRGFDLTNGVG